ncbi:MAG TPA: hypothetical protein VNE40_02225 [Candidatus Dormibacteraeota bacterium]|nr:hypothetical protein [Candidatus Dormibacteraeota bacterium]
MTEQPNYDPLTDLFERAYSEPPSLDQPGAQNTLSDDDPSNLDPSGQYLRIRNVNLAHMMAIYADESYVDLSNIGRNINEINDKAYTLFKGSSGSRQKQKQRLVVRQVASGLERIRLEEAIDADEIDAIVDYFSGKHRK